MATYKDRKPKLSKRHDSALYVVSYKKKLTYNSIDPLDVGSITYTLDYNNKSEFYSNETVSKDMWEYYKTDPVVIRMPQERSFIMVNDEETKKLLAEKFKFDLNPIDYFGEPDTIFPIPATFTLEDISKRERQITIPEPIKFKYKKTAQVHRRCPVCNTIHPATRGNISRNTNIYCSKGCANTSRSHEKIINTCKTCNTSYTSIIQEDYCCNECKDFSDTQPSQ